MLLLNGTVSDGTLIAWPFYVDISKGYWWFTADEDTDNEDKYSLEVQP